MTYTETTRPFGFRDDPRHFQIAALSTLIGLGVFQFGFEIAWWHVAAVLGGTLGTQMVADRVVGRAFEPRSALITALSLTILLRTGSVWLSLGAAVLAERAAFAVTERDRMNALLKGEMDGDSAQARNILAAL